MNRRCRQSPGGQTEYGMLNVNELGYEVRLAVALETVQGGTIFNGSMNWIEYCNEPLNSDRDALKQECRLNIIIMQWCATDRHVEGITETTVLHLQLQHCKWISGISLHYIIVIIRNYLSLISYSTQSPKLCSKQWTLLHHYPKYAIVIGPTHVTWYVQIITVDRCSNIRGSWFMLPRNMTNRTSSHAFAADFWSELYIKQIKYTF